MKLTDIEKMLRAIANRQSSFSQEIVISNNQVLKELKKVEINLEKKIDKNHQTITKVNHRINYIGKSLAYLEDDAPTRKEHEHHEKRLKKIENKVFA